MSVRSSRQTTALLTGVKGLLTCDSGAVVAGIVEFVVSQRPLVRRLGHFISPNGSVATLLITLNGLRCFLGAYALGSGDVLVAARRPNERRATDALKRIAPATMWRDVVFRWRIVPMARALGTLVPTIRTDWRRTVRLARMLIRRYGVFRALRSVELLAYYRRYSQILAARPCRMVVMSSHSNPHGIALNVAARRFGVPIVLITHGMPVRPIARLDYAVAIVECEVSKAVYEDAGCRIDHVIVKSRRRDHAPMRPLIERDLTIGVFLSKDPVEERVMSCIRALLTDPRLRRIFVRPHPVNLWRQLVRRIHSLRDNRIVLRATGSLSDDLRECDIVLAGNSTVLLDAVVAGRPACYVRGLDHGPYDVQDFVECGLICELSPEHPIDCSAIARFYTQSNWPSVLRRFADIDHSETNVAAAIRSAIDRLQPATRGVGSHAGRVQAGWEGEV